MVTNYDMLKGIQGKEDITGFHDNNGMEAVGLAACIGRDNGGEHCVCCYLMVAPTRSQIPHGSSLTPVWANRWRPSAAARVTARG